MLNKQLHPVRNGIIATVVGGLILSFIPQFRGFLVETMSWTWAGAAWVWTALLSHYSMPGWAFLIIGLCAFVGLARLCVVFLPKKKPAYLNYTEDMLDGAKWRWSWTDGKISSLWCFCPNCDAQLIYSERYDGKTDFICERCSPGDLERYTQPHGRIITTVKGAKDYAVQAIEREILRRIRTGESVHFNS